jgi:hypothetical protein
MPGHMCIDTQVIINGYACVSHTYVERSSEHRVVSAKAPLPLSCTHVQCMHLSIHRGHEQQTRQVRRAVTLSGYMYVHIDV